MFGIINLFKPSGPTSRDCVNQIQRLVRPHKVGHAGTLDPMADGVLLIAVGQAVRLVDWLHDLAKTYHATFELGKSSLSGDNQEEVTSLDSAPCLTRTEVAQVLPEFLGEISQVPPIYSAVRVDGKRAYDLARAGKKVEIAPRKVTIHRLGITSFDYPFVSMEIECGTGTYIRSLGQDIARRLSSDAIMINLRRTAIGSFDCQNTIQLDKLNSLEAVRDNFCNPVVGLSHLPQVTLDANQLIDIGHGKKLPLAQTTTPFLIGLDVNGNLRSILKPSENGLWSPHRNFEKPDD
jgi:tRNA pseudouridine55 synthase